MALAAAWYVHQKGKLAVSDWWFLLLQLTSENISFSIEGFEALAFSWVCDVKYSSRIEFIFKKC